MKLIFILVFQILLLSFQLSAQVIKGPFTDTLQFTRIYDSNDKYLKGNIVTISIHNKLYDGYLVFPMEQITCFSSSVDSVLAYYSILDTINSKREKRFLKFYYDDLKDLRNKMAKGLRNNKVTNPILDPLLDCIKNTYKERNTHKDYYCFTVTKYLVASYYIIECEKNSNIKGYKCNDNANTFFQPNQYILPVEYIKWWR